MKKLILFIICVGAALSMAACQQGSKEEGQAVQQGDYTAEPGQSGGNKTEGGQ